VFFRKKSRSRMVYGAPRHKASHKKLPCTLRLLAHVGNLSSQEAVVGGLLVSLEPRTFEASLGNVSETVERRRKKRRKQRERERRREREERERQRGQVWWLTSVIPATWETNIEGWWSQVGPGQS
jgi:hypothetical protein